MTPPTSGEPWVCPSCHSQNFGSRLTCLNCGAEKPHMRTVTPIQTPAEPAAKSEVTAPPVSSAPPPQTVMPQETGPDHAEVPLPTSQPQATSVYEPAPSPARFQLPPVEAPPAPEAKRTRGRNWLISGCIVIILFICLAVVLIWTQREWLMTNLVNAIFSSQSMDYVEPVEPFEELMTVEPAFPEDTSEAWEQQPVEEEPTAVIQPPTVTESTQVQIVPDVSYAGISFSHEPQLAWAVFPTTEAAFTELLLYAAPEHYLFDFDGYPNENESYILPEIRVYPAAEYMQINPDAGTQIESLRQALSQRPVLPKVPLPYLPVINAGQLITARIGFLDFQNGAGVRYLTQFGQDVYPINNADLLYTFQGLTSDSQYIVSASFPIQSMDLPANGSEVEYNYQEFSDSFLEYSFETIWLLEQATADTFIPDMEMLDDMLRTLLVRR
jgi:hypothetical protein